MKMTQTNRDLNRDKIISRCLVKSNIVKPPIKRGFRKIMPGIFDLTEFTKKERNCHSIHLDLIFW